MQLLLLLSLLQSPDTIAYWGQVQGDTGHRSCNYVVTTAGRYRAAPRFDPLHPWRRFPEGKPCPARVIDYLQRTVPVVEKWIHRRRAERWSQS